MMNVARQRPRNTITTKITKMKAYMMVSANELIASLISRDDSKMVSTLQSAGSVGMMLSRRF